MSWDRTALWAGKHQVKPDGTLGWHTVGVASGPASPQAALVYQHATAERDRAIADALGEMIVASLAAGVEVEDDRGDEDE